MGFFVLLLGSRTSARKAHLGFRINFQWNNCEGVIFSQKKYHDSIIYAIIILNKVYVAREVICLNQEKKESWSKQYDT